MRYSTLSMIRQILLNQQVDLPDEDWDSARISEWSLYLYRYLRKHVNHATSSRIAEQLDRLVALCPEVPFKKIAHGALDATTGLNPRIFSILYKYCRQQVLEAIPGSTKISIIIPTCNRDRRLDACLRHLLGYNLTRLTIVVRDNASSDETPLIIESIQKEYSWACIKYTRNSVNIGIFRNYLAALSSDEYSCCIIGTDDDLIPEEMISYSLWLNYVRPEIGLLYFDKRPHLRCSYPPNGAVFSPSPGHQSLNIVKAVNTIGGMVISGEALRRCSSRFPTEKNLIGHFAFALAISQQFPVGAISIDEFDPVINKFANLSSTSGINTSLNWENIDQWIKESSLDHTFHSISLSKQGLSNVIYLTAYRQSTALPKDSECATQFLSIVLPWWESWVGNRFRTLGLDSPNPSTFLLMILRFLRPCFISNLQMLCCMAGTLDRKESIIDEEMHAYIDLIILLVTKQKIKILRHFGDDDEPSILGPRLGLAGMLVRNSLSLDEATSIIEENLTPTGYAVLNCDPDPSYTIRSLRNNSYLKEAGRHSELLLRCLDALESRQENLLDLLAKERVHPMLSPRVLTANGLDQISHTLDQLLSEAVILLHNNIKICSQMHAPLPFDQ